MTALDVRACYFLDTSAFAKAFVREAGSRRVRALHEPDAAHVLATTRLVPIEFAAAIHRRARAGEIPVERATQAARHALDLVEIRYLVQGVTVAGAARAVEFRTASRSTAGG